MPEHTLMPEHRHVAKIEHTHDAKIEHTLTDPGSRMRFKICQKNTVFNEQPAPKKIVSKKCN